MQSCSLILKPHGQFITEFKIIYPVEKTKNRYTLEMYIISAKSLSVDTKKYGISSFLNDLKVLIRYTTPRLGIKELTDSDNPRSPLTRIRKMLTDTGDEDSVKYQNLQYEFRILTSALRVYLRTIRENIQKAVKKAESPSDIEKKINVLLDDLILLASEFRDLRKEIKSDENSKKYVDLFKWCDESISLNIQRELGYIDGICRDTEIKLEIKTEIISAIDQEEQYRKKRHYKTVLTGSRSTSGEDLVYRESILKKWSQSALYLNVEKSNTPARVAQVIAGIAAAVAMTFAVTTTLLTNKLLAQNTTAWAMAIVVAYIFKDRIKESLRAVLNRLVPRLIPDQMHILKDSLTEKRIGHSRAVVKFTSSDKLSEDITSERNKSSNPFRHILPPEDVIQYTHDVIIDGVKAHNFHRRMESVTEILRLDLSRWINQMDDPAQVFYHAVSGQLKRKRMPRVYHLHLLIRLKNANNGEIKQYHNRLVLNREGLHRIESLK